MNRRVQVFMIESVGRSIYVLRRYSDEKCESGICFYHNAIGPVFAETADIPGKKYYCSNPPEAPPKDDPRWPLKCHSCGRDFLDSDPWQVFGKPLYTRPDTGEVFPLEAAPAGAMWDATWWPGKGPDGMSLAVRLPDGAEWMIDGKANNCKCPPRDAAHRCWNRTGKAPEITVSPSIQSPSYHGFLRNGYLEEC